MKKLLYWSPFYLPDAGGIETLSARALPLLTEQGYQVEVIAGFGASDCAATEEYDGIRVNRFPFRHAFEQNNLKEILEIQKSILNFKQNFQPDIVHFNLSDPSILIHLQTQQPHVPTLLALHQELNHPAFRQGSGELFQKAIKDADWITSASTQAYNSVISRFPDLKERASIEHYGIDVSPFDPVPATYKPPILLCLSRLVPQKSVDRAIDAFVQILMTHPNAMLHIAGNGTERKMLEDLVQYRGLSSSVRFLGNIAHENVPEVMNSCSVFLLPSRWEAFPVAALEAAAAARTVVAFPAGDLQYLIKNKETGVIVPMDDVDAFAKAVSDLLYSPEKCSAMGLTARQHVENNLGMESYVSRNDALYRSISS